jgi:hypothetical protein
MHARTITRFGISPVAAFVLAASLLGNLALVIVALYASGSLPSVAGQSAQSAAPRAIYVDGAGDGRLGPALPPAAPVVTSSTNPYLGEGRASVIPQRAIRVSVPTAFNPYSGEGRASVIVQASDAISAGSETSQFSLAHPAALYDHYRFVRGSIGFVVETNNWSQIEAAAVAQAHMLEINALPGDDAQALPPTGELGTPF